MTRLIGGRPQSQEPRVYKHRVYLSESEEQRLEYLEEEFGSRSRVFRLGLLVLDCLSPDERQVLIRRARNEAD